MERVSDFLYSCKRYTLWAGPVVLIVPSDLRYNYKHFSIFGVIAIREF
jgi:hypothetical protein